MKKSKHFLYQINFNRAKYPEICEELEMQKEKEGIAWYLRQLISKDIERKKSNKVDYIHPPILEKENEQTIKKEKYQNLPDDNGGFI